MSVRQEAPGNGSGRIRQVNFDPRNPRQEDAWVLRRALGSTTAAGSLIGIEGFTYAEDLTAYRYDFSYRTKEGTTLRIRLEEDDPFYEAAKITTEDGDHLVTEGIRAGSLIGIEGFTYAEDQEGKHFLTDDGEE